MNQSLKDWQDPALSKAIGQLRTNCVRWREEIENGGSRGTLFQGIASKAANSFEKLLRDLLAHYLSICEMDYRQALRSNVGGKSLDKLTIQETITGFIKLNNQFTKKLRSLSPEIAQSLKNRSLFTHEFHRRLDEFRKLRNFMHHHIDQFAKDIETLNRNTARVLRLIENLLMDVFFRIAQGKPNAIVPEVPPDIDKPTTSEKEPSGSEDPPERLHIQSGIVIRRRSEGTTIGKIASMIPDRPAKARSLRLRIHHADGQHQVIELPHKPITLGTAADIQIHSPQNYVSRRHAAISEEDGSYFLTDLDSTNGTYLNGIRVQADAKTMLRSGDKIRLADVRVEVI